MATSKNIYEAHFWENNTDKAPKPFLISFSCPPRVTDPGEDACVAEICFPVRHNWQSVLTFLSSTTSTSWNHYMPVFLPLNQKLISCT